MRLPTYRVTVCMLALLTCLAAPACAVSPATGTPGPDDPGPDDPSPTAPDPTPDPTTPTDPDPNPPTQAVPPCPADADARFSATLDAFRSALASNGVPGGAIAMVCGGELRFVEAVGVRRRGDTAPVTTDTRFQWASSTKMFTAATALALEDAGIVDLRAPISTVLPFVAFGHISLHDLLTHTAGFPTDFDAFDPGLDAVVRMNASMAMWAPAGAVFNYSNPGYTVAGSVLENAAGEPFASLVRTYVTEPAGMQATLDAAEVARGDFAYGHSDGYWGSEPIAPDGAYYDTGYYAPMGGLWGSVRDLGRWAEIHVRNDGSVLSQRSVLAMREAHTQTTWPGVHYGYGHFVEPAIRPTVVHHGGSVPGFLTEFRVVPEAGLGLAVVINSDTYFPSEVVDEAMDGFVTFTYDDLRLPSGSEAFGHYVGRYQSSVFGVVEVSEVAGRLEVSFDGDRGVALEPYGGESYETTFRGETIDFNFWRTSPEADASYIVSLSGVAARMER